MSSYASNMINGLASYEKLGKQQFIAVLYTDSPTKNSADVLYSNNSRAMELVITSRSMSQRALGRMWIEGVSINASTQELTQNAEALASLTGLIKGRLRQNDRLRLEFSNGSLDVSLNGIDLGTVAKGGIFDLLLQTWIGEVPPSSDFRAQILAAGDVDSTLLSTVNSANADSDRIAAVQAWIAPPEVEVAAASAPAAVAAAPKPKPSAPQIKPSAPKIAATPKPKPAAPKPKPAAPKPKPKPVEVATAPKAEPKASAQPVKPAPVKPVQVAKAAPPIEEDDDDEVLAFTAADILREKQYYEELKARVFSKVEYPKQALSQRREGAVGLDIVVNSKGELVDVSLRERSAFSYFNRAATRAVRKSEPFPTPPKALLTNGKYEFKLNVVYRL
ncbi:hypothetical protein GCM10007877_14710 [Marinibactrum halimedae]|uniref:Protein TonB n=2 Tax=Marinibactrum halimedae TaxID=1444977 RepID=A0AA37T6R3_9GAMM|nr:hypothetical protein GCM10007877_14710 [Marinibactrum halimedae]